MKVLGLTGGIGSGKSTVLQLFKDLGIPVYIADLEAKKIMVEDLEVVSKVKKLLGDQSYENGILNRTYIADKVFNDRSLLQQLNSIVHPAVGNHFKKWSQSQEAPYVVKEVAILFENGGHLSCDFVVTVYAPLEDRINRVMLRDGSSREAILARINNQWSDDQKLELSDYAIENIKLEDLPVQVDNIHKDILKILNG